jgi:hypothetical protein
MTTPVALIVFQLLLAVFCLLIQVRSIRRFRFQTRTYENTTFHFWIIRCYFAVCSAASLTILTCFITLTIAVFDYSVALLTAADLVTIIAAPIDVMIASSITLTHAALVHACAAPSPSAVRRRLRILTAIFWLVLLAFLLTAAYAVYLDVISIRYRSYTNPYPNIAAYNLCNQLFRFYLPAATLGVSLLCMFTHAALRVQSSHRKRSVAAAQLRDASTPGETLGDALAVTLPPDQASRLKSHQRNSLAATERRFGLAATVTLPLLCFNDALLLYRNLFPVVETDAFRDLLAVAVNLSSIVTFTAMTLILLTFGHTLAEAIANTFSAVTYATKTGGTVRVHWCWPWRRRIGAEPEDVLPTWDETSALSTHDRLIGNPLMVMSSAPSSIA